MNTGIFIRAQIDGRWLSVDIGDTKLTADQTLIWLRSRGGMNHWAENVVLALLGKEQIARADDVAPQEVTP